MTNAANLFKVSYTIIHTEGVSSSTVFSTSVKRAIKQARREAWLDHDEVSPSNWADVWLDIRKGNKPVYQDFAPGNLL